MVADDHASINRALTHLLAARGLTVVGQAKNGQEVLDLVRKHSPDVVVLDLFMPLINGIEATRAIKKESPTTLAVGFSGMADFYTISAFIDAGGMGFVVKTQSPGEVVDAVEAVAKGESYFCTMSSRMLGSGDGDAHLLMKRVSLLSDGERQVWTAICEAKTSFEIATQMCLSVRTVEGHRRRLAKKLGCDSVASLMRIAEMVSFVAPQWNSSSEILPHT